MQEDTYDKIVKMKGMYLTDLKEMYQKIVDKIQQLSLSSSLPPFHKLPIFRVLLKRCIAFLQIRKSNISPTTSQKLPLYERQIINFIKYKQAERKLNSEQPHKF